MNYSLDIFTQFDKKWALVTAGNADSFNTMTISWGGMGTIWNKPVATVYVRTSRFTHEFIDNNDYFTISFFPEEYKGILGVLGSNPAERWIRCMRPALRPCRWRTELRLRKPKQLLYAENSANSRLSCEICRKTW